MPAPLPEVTLEGARVRLEPLTLAHADELWAATGPSRSTYGLTRVPTSREDAVRYIQAALAMRESGDALPFATRDRRSGQVVGSTRFYAAERWVWPNSGPADPRPFGLDAIEIGYTWLNEAAQGRRINTEAKRLMFGHAFEVWRVRRVDLKTDVRNLRSRAAIEGLGAKLDGILRWNQPAYDGGVRNSALYSILESEWPAVRARLDAKLGR